MGSKFKKFLIVLCFAFGLVCDGGQISVNTAQAEIWETLVNDARLTSADSFRSHDPSLGVDSAGNVHIAWMDERDGNWDIYYTKLDNDGNALANDIRLTSANIRSVVPRLEVDGSDNIHIVWHDQRDGNDEIYYTKLDNDGNTIVDDRRLTYDSRFSAAVVLGVDNTDNVHAVWYDQRNVIGEIYYTKLDNSGNTIVDDRRLTSVSAESDWPILGLDNSGNVHIVWSDMRDGNWEIYYTKLDNNGNTIVDDRRLTNDNAISYNGHPKLGVDSTGNVHIAWMDERDGNWEIYYTKLDNNGNTVVDDRRLTYDSSDSQFSSLVVDISGNIHITWVDDRDANYEIYYTKLDNDGNTLVEDTRLTIDSASSYHPSLEVDISGDIHVAWSDTRDGNYEIYYTKGTSILCTDVDRDGYAIEGGGCGAEIDCDDGDSGINPGACDIRNNGIDEDCLNGDRTTGQPCPGPAEICDNTIDDDGDGDVDCDDRDCRRDPACSGPAEICDNTIDDDGDGDVDCDDRDCNKDSACGGTEKNCKDGVDNDNDTFTDCDDSDCVSSKWCP